MDDADKDIDAQNGAENRHRPCQIGRTRSPPSGRIEKDRFIGHSLTPD
jgi:hypothetical protein